MSASSVLVQAVPRLVGRYASGSGAKLVVLGGIHGNEPAGLRAGERVLRRLQELAPPFAGEIVVIAGNTRALAADRRFLSKDLNRQFTPERVAAIRSSAESERADPEDAEMFELLQVLDAELGAAGGAAYYLDLHTTSAEGIPFVLFGDTLRNRAFADHVPLPIILGLEEQLDGTLLEHVNRQGYVTLGCEGGQHSSPAAVENHASLIWLALYHAGILGTELPEVREARVRLRRARGSRPHLVEVRYRHSIGPRDGFRMEPGFSSFDRVAPGRLLARDVRGEVRARWAGWVLMPLYQGLGEDGFFLASDVQPFWLFVSTMLRRARLAVLLQLLPGVTRHRDREDSLVVDTRIARWFPLEIFHLFGFRKLRWHGPVLIVSRRPHDLSPPTR
ncbi:MAG: succinylglutamate desuccinylase/aspartoacylase family protein [Candidatus Eisenbacteria bacterium]|uniref:Succinylglutamate desuccinylase/aspartoacylase family protein n=1 Tax=Eiseniibacteriota bacterium TaxID=2212470 RepID=A0A956M2V9_UNCEI|nr:succinylglutamate desuccinylase/aspartoacylase family protein [Candidatus Eisenbacteria bacterium]